MKIALISDKLTHDSLNAELYVKIKNIIPLNYKVILKLWKPDILFVESAWQGHKNKWKFKIASYPDYPRRNNKKLQKVVSYCKKLGIPTVFWNKEDGVHFDRFIDSAKLFDYIFTVDENCIPKYKKVVDKNTQVNTLMFAVQPKFHNFTGINFKYKESNFVGSYSHHIHNKRREWQDMMFKVSSDITGLVVFDRNSERKSKNYRYPILENIKVNKSVSYRETSDIYKDYMISLNVNTIEDSETMFSRRLVEIIACGGIAITNNSPAVEKYFKDFCYTVSNEEELVSLLSRLNTGGLLENDLQRLKEGAKYIAENHTWTHRLEEIYKVLGLKNG